MRTGAGVKWVQGESDEKWLYYAVSICLQFLSGVRGKKMENLMGETVKE